MRKNVKKGFGLLLTLMIALAAVPLSGCDGSGTGPEPIDKTKTQIYVGTYDGAYGDKWLSSAKAIFEAKYAERSFEDEKKGVQVVIYKKDKFLGTSLRDTIQNEDVDVFFTEDVNYYDIVGLNKLADITDVVTGTLSEFGEEATIESKLDDSVKNFLKRKSDGKYFALPFYEAYGGIMYDMDLFEKNYFYLSDRTTDSEVVFVSKNYQTKSNGPDNQPGTLDDGLPATYEEFFKLCDHIVDAGMTPFVWSGAYPNYLTYLLQSLWADYEGRDELMVNFTFNDDTDLLKMNGGSIQKANGVPVTERVTITPETGMNVARQPGRYYALEFLKGLLTGNGYRSSLCTSNFADQNTTHLEFLKSAYSNVIERGLKHILPCV